MKITFEDHIFPFLIALVLVGIFLLIGISIYIDIRDGPMSYGVVLSKNYTPESVELQQVDKDTTIPVFHAASYSLLIEGYTVKNVFKKSWVSVDQIEYQKYSVGDSYGKSPQSY